MPTNTQTLTSSWSLIQAGAISAISLQAGNQRVYYRLGATPPADSEGGHALDPRDGVTVIVSSGDNLYARAADKTAILHVTT